MRMYRSSPGLVFNFGDLLSLFRSNFALLLLVGLFLLESDPLLFASDGLKVTSNEQVDQLPPLLVGLEGASQDHHLSGEHPEDSGDGLGHSVVAGDDDVNKVERSVSVAEGNRGDVDVGGFNNGLVVGLGVSDDQQAGLLELLGDLVGQCSGNPTGRGRSSASSVLSELVDSSLSVFLGADDDDLGKVGDRGDDTGSELDSAVDLVHLEDVVASSVAAVAEGLHVMVDLFGSQVHLNRARGTLAAKRRKMSVDCRSELIATQYINIQYLINQHRHPTYPPDHDIPRPNIYLLMKPVTRTLIRQVSHNIFPLNNNPSSILESSPPLVALSLMGKNKINKISLCEGDVALTQGAPVLLFDPFIHAAQVEQVHALYFGQFLTLLNPIQTNGTILVLQRGCQKPAHSILIGLLILLPEQPLVSDPQDHVNAMVQHRIMNGPPKEGIVPQLRMIFSFQPLVLLRERQEEASCEQEQVVAVQLP